MRAGPQTFPLAHAPLKSARSAGGSTGNVAYAGKASSYTRATVRLIAFSMTLTSIGTVTSVGFLSIQSAVALLAGSFQLPRIIGGPHSPRWPTGFSIVAMVLIGFLSIGFIGGWLFPIDNYTQPTKAVTQALGISICLLLAFGLGLAMLRNPDLIFVAIQATLMASLAAASVALLQEFVWIVTGNPESFTFDFLNGLAGQPVWWYASAVGPIHRVNSYMQEPAHLARVLTIVTPLCLIRLGLCGGRAARSLTGIVGRWTSIIIVAAFILTFSIAAWVGLFVGIAACLLLLASARRLSKSALAYLCISGLIIFGAIGAIADENFGRKVSSITNVFDRNWWQDSRIVAPDISSLSTAVNIAVAERNVAEMPLTGAGFGGHPARFDDVAFGRLYAIRLPRLNSEDAASLFLRALSETGLIGLILLLISLGLPVWRSLKQVRTVAAIVQNERNLPDPVPLLAGLTGGLLSVFMVYLVRNGPYMDLNYWFPFAILLGVAFCKPQIFSQCFVNAQSAVSLSRSSVRRRRIK